MIVGLFCKIMKKRSIFILFVLFTICACSQVKLSCNEEIDRWAKEHITEYECAPRDSMVVLPYSHQRALFNGLSPEKKCELWLIKKDEIMTSEDYSSQEKVSINELFDSLSPKTYTSKTAKNEFLSFASCWEEKMRSVFNWDDERLFFTVCTWMNKVEFFESVRIDELLTTKGNGDVNNDCNCRYDIYCSSRISGEICDHDSNCDEVGGCGVFGTSSCNGVCK